MAVTSIQRDAKSGYSEQAMSAQMSPSDESDDDFADAPVDSLAGNELKLLEVIGKGGYGTVHRAIWKGQLVAAKIIEHDERGKGGNGILSQNGSFCPYEREDTVDNNGEVPIDNSLTEGALSWIMKHPNIVRCLGYEVVATRSPSSGATHEIRLLMEFCDRGSLDKAVEAGIFHSEENGSVKVNMHHVLKTLIEIAYALRHLHNRYILHRDLKIQNILLKQSNKDFRRFTVKVSDFGLAKIWDGRGGDGLSPTEKQKYAGTVTHMAPELIENGDVSTKCDVYAFGILMWELYTRLTPYKGLGPPQILMGVVSSKLRPAFASTTPQAYVDLAKWCWAQDPEQRPNFSQIAKFLLLILESHSA